jgi:hypothetical protein
MATAQVLPKELRLSAPPTMPQARSYLFKQQSVLSQYEPGSNNVITINLPRLQRSYLTKDSYLKFRIELQWNNDTNTSADLDVSAPCFDTPGAFGLFDRIEIYDYLGSTLLESTAGHAQLMALLMDTQTSSDELAFHYGTNSGTKGGNVMLDREYGIGDDYVTSNRYTMIGSQTGHVFQIPNLTDLYSAPGGGNKTNDSQTYAFEFCIPMFSFLGLLSQKFAPLHNGYTINLTMSPVARALGFCNINGVIPAGHQAPSTYILSNVYYCCQILELGPVAESMLISSTQGQPFVVPSKAYRNYVGSVPAGASSYRLDLNLNVASLTNILWIMRESAYANNIKWRCLSYRIRNYLQSWYFQYGSTVLPQTSGIQAYSANGADIDSFRGGYNESYCELMKARHNFNATNFNTNISKRNYWIDTAALGAANEYMTTAAAPAAMALTADSFFETGKFAAGLDLELVSGRSNDLVCGMNTNGMNTSINLTFNSDKSPNVVAANVDCWCEYDSFINISPGIATTVSF